MRASPLSFFRHLATGLAAFIGFGLCLSCLSAVEQRLGLVGKERRLPHSTAPVSIPQIGKNLSGVTWNPNTGTLFAVTNSPQAIYELTPGGSVLRRITLEGFSDTEDITHIEDDRFAVIEERRGLIRVLRIAPQTTHVRADDCRSIDLGSRHEDNKGFESLFFDPSSRRLLTMRELPPYEIVSLPLDGANGTAADRFPVDMNVHDVAALGRDVSGDLWVLSEASACIVRLDDARRERYRIRLEAGSLPLEPEGLAFGLDGRVFIVGEPNTFVAANLGTP